MKNRLWFLERTLDARSNDWKLWREKSFIYERLQDFDQALDDFLRAQSEEVKHLRNENASVAKISGAQEWYQDYIEYLRNRVAEVEYYAEKNAAQYWKIQKERRVLKFEGQ